MSASELLFRQRYMGSTQLLLKSAIVQELLSGIANSTEDDGSVSAAVWFLLLRAADKFQREKGRWVVMSISLLTGSIRWSTHMWNGNNLLLGIQEPMVCRAQSMLWISNNVWYPLFHRRRSFINVVVGVTWYMCSLGRESRVDYGSSATERHSGDLPIRGWRAARHC